MAALLLSLAVLGWADHDDDHDDNNGPDFLPDCNYDKKPWKEMSQGQKKLNILRPLKYDTLKNGAHVVRTAVVFMAPKSLQLDGLQFRSKFTKKSWYESARGGGCWAEEPEFEDFCENKGFTKESCLLPKCHWNPKHAPLNPEDRHGHIVKSSEYFSTADTVNHHLQKFDSAQSMENFGRGSWLEYSDEGEYDDLFNDLPDYENDYTFYYVEGEWSPSEWESFTKARIEIWRLDNDGKMRVDACTRIKWE